VTETIKLGECEYKIAGMLSAFPQCDELRRAFRKATGKDSDDLPIVLDQFAPRHFAYFAAGCVLMGPQAFVEHDVETAWIMPKEWLP
jgi:hypothetical protein